MSRLESAVARLQAEGRLPSVVAAEVQDGEIAEAVVVESTLDTQYRIGSITKTLVAVAVLQARDRGLLDLDDELGRFVPAAAYASVTLRQLLAHTGGLQSEPAGTWWERSPGLDVAELLRRNDGSGAVAQPPSWFHYSNLGFALLGEVLARVHARGWWQVVRDDVIGPLGMPRTTYAPVAPFAQGSSVVHLTGELETEPHHDTGAMAPAGQVWSTVADLARWAGFLVAGHADVLAPETLREMAADAWFADYGLGLRRVPVDGATWVGHSGSMPGFLASLFVDPATSQGTVLLTNATTGIVTEAVPALVRSAPDRVWVDPWRPTTEVPDLVRGLLGYWYWGNTALELRWSNQRLESRRLATDSLTDVFALQAADAGTEAGERIVGVEGYHRGETLHVFADRLECATFVYTRTPYGRP